MKFKFWRKPKTDAMYSLGWVNVYRRHSGDIMLSGIPKLTKQESINCKAINPISTYLGTVEIFTKVKP